MFFHGSEHKINNFTDDFVGGKEAHDQEGPGIYFTSSSKNARSYGPYVYTVKLHPKKLVSTQEGKSASIKEIEWLIKQAPNWEMHAENFNENPNLGVKIAAKNILEYDDNPHQQFLQVWIDFYRNSPVDYVRNMVKLGYDAIKIEGLESIIAGEGNITHIIVLNPAIIEFVDMEDDRTEEEKSIQEIRKFVRKTLTEGVGTSCPKIKITQEIIDEVSKFETSEQLLRAGGLSVEALDRAAFGFTSEDITTLRPNKLHIKWADDWENVKWEQEKSGLSKKAYSTKINLTEPIQVSYEKGKFYVEDGHHRLFAASVLKMPLNVELEIKDNPIIKLAPDLSYEDFHRCIFKQVKSSQKNIYKEGVPNTFDKDYDLSKHNFNTGDCDIYAVSLHRLYGYPLYVVRGHFLEPEWGGEREWDYEDSHIVVKLPNGKYLDSQGETTEAELRQNTAYSNDIQKITIEPIDEETALSTFSCENQEPVIKQVMNYIKSKKDLSENRYEKGNEKYTNCLMSDLARMDIIEAFLKKVEQDPDYNIEEPDYDMLLDPYDGYDDQIYIQNDLKNGKIIFREGWSSLCWEGLYSKSEYKGLSKEASIKKIFRERIPRIAQEFNMSIESADYFFHVTSDEMIDDGFIMKIVLKKSDLTETIASNYSLDNWPEGSYKGFIKGYEVYSDEVDSGFKATTGLRNMSPIPCVIHIKDGHGIAKFKGGTLFSDKEIENKFKKNN